MLVGTAAPGRPIVILFSDGDDTASFLDEGAVIETAQRSGVGRLRRHDRRRRQAPPAARHLTGGVFVKETSLERVGARFPEILESFRRRYLISFTPTGVGKDGWHKLSVKVKGGGEVRARPGYWAGS